MRSKQSISKFFVMRSKHRKKTVSFITAVVVYKKMHVLSLAARNVYRKQRSVLKWTYTKTNGEIVNTTGCRNVN